MLHVTEWVLNLGMFVGASSFLIGFMKVYNGAVDEYLNIEAALFLILLVLSAGLYGITILLKKLIQQQTGSASQETGDEK